MSAYFEKLERANATFQEKLEALRARIDEGREQSEAVERLQTESLATRLKMIEESLTTQRDQEIEVTRKSNRVLVTVAAIFGCAGLCAMAFTGWFLFRAMNRLSEVAGSFPPALGAPMAMGLDEGPRQLESALPENNRLLGVIDRLEKRIYQLEHTTSGGSLKDESNGDSVEVMVNHGQPLGERNGKVSILVAKAESLMNLDQPAKALECFEDALRIKPGQPELLVKKGTALERLKRWDEALATYDQAIASDATLTLAYLYKGGVYNQLEKFGQALECYEQALKTQQKEPA